MKCNLVLSLQNNVLMPKNWILILSFFTLFSSCERVSVDHDGLAAAYLDVNDDLVDSLLNDLSQEEKIGQLFIWQGNEQNSNFERLPDLLDKKKISGFAVDQINSSAFIQMQDSLSQFGMFAPFVFIQEPVFIQNAFSDVESLPDPVNFLANRDFNGFGSFWDFSSSSAHQMGINMVKISPIAHLAKKGSAAYGRIISDNEESILRNTIGEMNAWQQNQALTFSVLNDQIYNPNDTLIHRNYPWRTLYSLVQSGLDGIVIDTSLFDGKPSDIIKPDFISNFLSEQIEFEGLKISQMSSENTLARAYLTGVDLMITSLDPRVAKRAISELINSSLVASSMLDNKVRKILKARIWLTDTDGYDIEKSSTAISNLNSENFIQIKKKLLEEAPSLIYNRNDFLPIKNSTRRFRIIEFGASVSTEFGKSIEFYADAGTKFFEWDREKILTEFNDAAFVGRPVLFYLNNVELDVDRDSALLVKIKNVLSANNSVLINIGNPGNLALIDTVANSIIQAFDNSMETQNYLGEFIFGGRAFKGIFPLTLDSTFISGSGLQTEVTRIRTGTAKEVGMDPTILYRLDLLAKKGIKDGAFPGCQIAILKEGKLVYEKSFGHLDSAKLETVKWNNLYDVASVSKVAGTALVAMREYELKTYKISDRISKHLDLSSKSRIKRVTIKDLLTHRSGIQPAMPIVPIVYPKNIRPDVNAYTSNKKTGPYQIEVAKDFYFNIHSKDSIWQRVENLTAKRKKFRYSDVNFMLLQRIFEKKTQLSLDQYLDKHYYQKLNLRRTAYKPLRKFDVSEIAPTAHDRFWRLQELRGYVHDESAALEGGVGGSAGLFANARDLSILGQLMLNKGVYGGTRFLEEKTLDIFTRASYGNHRGLAFDKRSNSKKSNLSRKISSSSYGHKGFTGALFWVDPKYDLVFIFNTNRVHPKVNNKILNKKQLRRKMQDAVYRSILKKKKEDNIELKVNIKY